MRNKGLVFSFAALTIAAVSIFTLVPAQKTSAPYAPRDNRVVATSGIHGAMDWVMKMRANQTTGLVSTSDILAARKSVEMFGMNGSKAVGLNWSEVDRDNVGGRTRAILIDRTNPSIVYAGGVSGGLWKSTSGGSSWTQVPTVAQNIAISSIGQDKLGNIYVGTGESYATAAGTANGSTGFIGGGMYFSSDGTNFSLLSPTIPANNSTGAQWAFINKIACCPLTGRVYAATGGGLKFSDNQGTSWSSLAAPLQAAASNDVKVATDGTVIASIANKCYINDQGTNSFVNHSTGATNKLPASGVGRIEFAFAPSDPNYIYASAAANNGTILGIFRSINKGLDSTLIGPPGSQAFQPFRNQGTYNNVIAVYPNNKNKIILGGIDMWGWEQGSTFTQKTLWSLDPSSQLYIHADQHVYVFHPTNPNILYTGSDGGVSRSLDGGETFHTLNKKYSTIQFYAISHGPRGEVLGGTQDNGTLMMDRKGNFPTEGYKTQGGDGGWTAISHLNPRVYVSTTYYAGMQTTPDYGKTKFYANQFFSSRMLSLGTPGDSWPASFVTPLVLWETPNHPNPADTVVMIMNKTAAANSTVQIRSNINKYPFNYVTPTALAVGDTLKVQDIVQSRLYLGGNNTVWMTPQIHQFGKELKWYKVAMLTAGSFSTVQTMSISKDGNHLFVGTSGGQLYRISNLNMAVDSLTADVGDLTSLNPNCLVETTLLSGLNIGSRNITSIAVDPKNTDRIVVTVGNYGNNDYVYYSSNATSATPTFVSKQGNLPKMPVYASIIEMNNSTHVIIGTEYGIYATDNINAGSVVWAEENTGLNRTPVYMLTQQLNNLPYMEIVNEIEGEVFVDIYPGTSNYGVVYAGTHGRGAFESQKYLSIEKSSITKTSFKPSVSVYPNPVVDMAKVAFTLEAATQPVINIFDLSGRLIRSEQLSRFNAGSQTAEIQVESLVKGLYILQITANGKSAATKFVVK